MKTPTIKPREYSASEITSHALKVLHLRGFEVWRNNNVRAVRGRTFTGRKGVSDIMGFHMVTGCLLACEVKKIGDKLSDDQIEFLSKVRDAGAFAMICTQQGTEITLTPYGSKGEMK